MRKRARAKAWTDGRGDICREVGAMGKAWSVALLVAGIVLLTWGLGASHSLSSDFSRLFTGSPTNKAVWLLIGGLVCGILGFFGLLRRP